MNKCLSKAIVYKATVEQTGKYYIGITEMEFKRRLAKHKHSFKNQADKNSTTLSHHVWESNLAPTPQIKWEVMKKSTARRPGDRECQLCLEEKLQILKQNKNFMCLNKRSELSNRCVIFHRSKHKLSNVMWFFSCDQPFNLFLTHFSSCFRLSYYFNLEPWHMV